MELWHTSSFRRTVWKGKGAQNGNARFYRYAMDLANPVAASSTTCSTSLSHMKRCGLTLKTFPR